MWTIVVLIRILMSYGVEGSSLEGKVVGGDNASIAEFPHSVLLSIQCETENSIMFGIPYTSSCGASVLNQRIVLTAAHCFELCLRATTAVAYSGSAAPRDADSTLAALVTSHPHYDPGTIVNDIALVALRHDLRLRESVARVIISPAPPTYTLLASVAGWGLIDEDKNIMPDQLQHLKYLRMMTRAECARVLGERVVPPHTLCAGDVNQNNYVSNGDSGSALMVGAAQVGVVSFKGAASRSLIVYTDVAHFYSWIQPTANTMHCLEKEREETERKEKVRKEKERKEEKEKRLKKAEMERKEKEERQIKEELDKIKKEIDLGEGAEAKAGEDK